MSSYARVRDYREHLLRQKPNVEIYLDNRLGAQDVLDLARALIDVAGHPRTADQHVLLLEHDVTEGLEPVVGEIDPDLVGLDTGCVWGRQLTAVRLDKNAHWVYQVEGQT